MAWYDNAIKFGWPNVLVMVGAAVMVPVLLPAVGQVVRPVVKGAFKAGFALRDMAVGCVAEAGEQMSDLMAEAKAEHYARTDS